MYAGGGIMAGKTLSSMKLGSNVVVAGLCSQILFFGFFVTVAVVFDSRIRKSPTVRSSAHSGISWRRHLNALYAASALILIRSTFRVVEYVQGNDGYLMRHEVYSYIFDSVLMLAVMVLFNIVHPSEVQAQLRGGKASKGGLKMYDVSGMDVSGTNV